VRSICLRRAPTTGEEIGHQRAAGGIQQELQPVGLLNCFHIARYRRPLFPVMGNGRMIVAKKDKPTVQLLVQIPVPVRRWLDRQKEKHGSSMTFVVTRTLEAAMDSEKRETERAS
jgi:hypothetical protein